MGALFRQNDPRVIAVGYYAPYHDFDILPRSRESACFQLVPYEDLGAGLAESIAEEAEGGAVTWPWEEQRPAGDPSISDCFATFKYEKQSYEHIDQQWVDAYMTNVEQEGIWIPGYAEMFGDNAVAKLRRERPECIEVDNDDIQQGPLDPGTLRSACIDEDLAREIRRRVIKKRFGDQAKNAGGPRRVGRFCLQSVGSAQNRTAVPMAWSSNSLIDEHNGFFTNRADGLTPCARARARARNH